jgi:hydroxymethylglutaryl-CoA lyase
MEDKVKIMDENKRVVLVECPRDAMQGWASFIPTASKIEYINSLLRVGFDTIDFGSFVSPKAIPQMADTAEVIRGLDLSLSRSKLLAIVANERGAQEAVEYDEITFLGFPFSLSPTFQLRNTNATMEESLQRVDAIQERCIRYGKQLVVYMSMGFGNPYGDVYNDDMLVKWAGEMVKRNIGIISLADTVGLATPEQISFAVGALIPEYPNTQFGVHLHSSAVNWESKLESAQAAGCLRFDGALKGIGGCPMAGDDLVGNMDTAKMIYFLEENNRPTGINQEALLESLELASRIFI